MHTVQAVILICLVCFFLNLPFGFMRNRTRKFSFGWFVCIHAPIPIVAFLRITTHTSTWFIPLFLVISLAGQYVGSRVNLSD